MTGDVLLRDVTEGDLPIFFEHQLDVEDSRIIGGGFTSRGRDAFMAHWAKMLRDQTVATRAVLVDGQVAGNVMTFLRSGVREVGYWIGREYRGRGVATRALSTFLEQIGERPLYAYVTKANVGSRRVLEKCGFRICDDGDEHSGGTGDDGEGLRFKLDAEPQT